MKTLTTWQNFVGDTGKAVTPWNYDSARGWLLNKRYADNQGPTYTYKPSGRLLTRTWARTPAVTTTYVYNAAGDLATTDYSDSTPDVVVTYDRSGRPASMTDGVGARTLGYHASGQLEDETYTTGALSGVVVDRSFDSLHRLSGVGIPAVTTATYGYDNASRMETVTVGATTATYAYAANSPLIDSVVFKQSGATRLTTTKTYDALNRLAAIGNQPSAAGAAALSYAYRYDSANQRTRATREDNAYWSYGYDALGQVTSGKKFQAGGTAVSGHDFAWTFDDIGNRKRSTANAQTTTYTPNALNQYQQRTVPGVVEVMGAADPAATVTVSVDNGAPQPTTRQGELFHRQVSVTNTEAGQNPALKITGVKNLAGSLGEDVIFEVTRNAFVAQTPEVFVHDPDGNLTADARWAYTWDGENRLVALETSAAAVALGVARQRLEFAYDGQSRRIAKKVSNWNGTTWVLASHTLFVYDGWNMVAELNALSGNAAVRTYVWGLDLSGTLQGAGGVGGLLAITNVTASETHVYAYDGNGNVAGLARASDGALSARYDYNAFGEPILIEGAFAEANGIRFSSKYTDSETGYLYYGYRYYQPSTGRWPNRDPLEEEGGENLYGFVANDPVGFFDSDGQQRTAPRVRPNPRERTPLGWDTRRQPPPRRFPRSPAPRLGFPDDDLVPEDITDIDHQPASPQIGVQLKRDEKTCCEFFFEGYDRGGYPPHTALLARRFSYPLEFGVVVKSPDGDTARFDAGTPNPIPHTVAEGKTGRRWAFFQQRHQWSYVQSDKIFKGDQTQFANQQRVAAKCKLRYLILFDNEYGLQGYRQLLPQFAPHMQ